MTLNDWKYWKYWVRMVPVTLVLLFLASKVLSLAWGLFAPEAAPEKMPEMVYAQRKEEFIPELGIPRIPTPQTGQTPMPEAKQEPFKDRFLLNGVESDGASKIAYFFDKNNGELKTIALGEVLEGRRLAEIESNRVRFDGVEGWFYLGETESKQ